MINITPQGVINLCKTPLENDYKNQLTFTSKSNQLSYFNSKIIKTYEDYTYIKKDNIIKVPENIDKIINCNYLFYKNIGFTNKTYYCFITNMEYINENCTAITFETDCFQTWQFDINYNKCFVEREHVSDDTIGKHTIPENLEHGEYICNKETTDFRLGDSNYICIATNGALKTSENPNRMYNGIFSGLVYNICKTFAAANTIIRYLDNEGRTDAINSIFMVPSSLCLDTTTWNLTYDGVDVNYYIINSSNDPINIGTIGFNRPTKIGNSYIPKNNKLYTFPYCYFNLTNNNGISASFNYEDFSNLDRPTFEVNGVISPGCSIKAIPLNYKKVNKNIEESINCGKFPICSWSSDTYTNWLTQNSINIGMSEVSGGISIIGGIVTGNIGGIFSGAKEIGNLMSEKYQHSLQPIQSRGNTNAGDVTFSTGNTDFNIYYKSIKDEYAKIIDDYFQIYGYKVNSLKIPNLTNRENWNYVKTIDCNFDGNIPQVDMNIIKSMFDKGVTLWHNPNTMYDYSQSNN